MCEISLKSVYFASEPELPVIGSPLHLGYRLISNGKLQEGRCMIVNFLASVYARRSRQTERSTENYVRQIYRERRRDIPADKSMADQEIVLEAAARRFDDLHLPLMYSILCDGYKPAAQYPVTMFAHNGNYFVRDGKNRCSILAALGHETISEVRIEK